jgi:6-phosphofructokinase 1
MDPAELAELTRMPVGYDAHGNIRLEKIPLADVLEHGVVRRFEERDEKFALVSVTLGYEMRCAAPIPFDIDYTRTLGNGAVRFLLAENEGGRSHPGGIVCLEDGRLHVLPFEDLQDPDTGRINTRMVDVSSEHFRVAREYMIRIEREDLAEGGLLAQIAGAAGMSPAAFAERFRPVVEGDVRGAG